MQTDNTHKTARNYKDDFSNGRQKRDDKYWYLRNR